MYKVNTIFILDREKKIIDTITGTGKSPFFDDIYDIDLDTGTETYTFSQNNSARYSESLVGLNHILFKFKGKFKLFQIISIEADHKEGNIISGIYCENTGISLINEPAPVGTITGNIKIFLDIVLKGTNFVTGEIDKELLTKVLTIKIDSKTNVLKAIQENIAQFGCEIEFVVEVDNNRITKQKINVYKERGNKTYKRFVYGDNIESLNKSLDWMDFCTAIIPFGKDDITIDSAEWKKSDGKPVDKPLNQNYVANMDAYSIYNNNGRHIFGYYESDANNVYDLLQEGYEQSIERGKPKADYEIKVCYDDDLDIGDTIVINDFDFKPKPLLLEARVSNLKISFSDETKCEATFSNYKEVESKIKSLKKEDIMSEVLGYLSELEAGIISETDIKMLREYMEKMNIEKEEIDNLFLKYEPIINTTTIKGSNINIILEDKRTYKCETLDELLLSLGDTNVDNENFTSIVEFQTGFDCYPMKYSQPLEIYMTGEDTKNGILLNKADTSYKITISYDNNQTVPRKFKGVVEVLSRGTGEYKFHEGFSHRDEMMNLAKQYYDNRSLFKYNQTTPLTYYNQGLDPVLYLENWKTDELYHIDCSTFVNQLFRARGYLNSIYKNLTYGMGASKKYGWGFDIGRTAADQAKWCIENGYQLDISTTDEEAWWNLQPGDLVFWQTRSGDGENALDRFMGVSHVAIVRTPKTDSGTTTTFEVSTIGEVVLNRSLQNNYPEKILFFARVRR